MHSNSTSRTSYWSVAQPIFPGISALAKKGAGVAFAKISYSLLNYRNRKIQIPTSKFAERIRFYRSVNIFLQIRNFNYLTANL